MIPTKSKLPNEEEVLLLDGVLLKQEATPREEAEDHPKGDHPLEKKIVDHVDYT